MSIPSILQTNINEAWNNMGSWVQSQLPTVAKGSLPNYSYSSEIGVCPLLDSPAVGGLLGALAPLTGGLSVLLEGDIEANGNGTMNLVGMTLNTLSGTNIAPASFGDSTVVLPVKFAQLEVSGSFNYTQPCKRKDLGITVAKFDTSGSGNVTLTSNQQQINFTCNVNSQGGVSIVSAAVTGSMTAVASAVKQPKTPLGDLADVIENALGDTGAEQALGMASPMRVSPQT